MGHVLPIAILLDANCSEYSENDSDQKCLACKDNYSFVNGNCIYSENTIKIKFEYTENIIDICPNNYIMDEVLNICVRKTYDQTSSKEFKNQILRNVTSFVNSSTLINGSDFIAVVLSSDEIDPKEQIKKGISAIDLGNCTEQIKEYYNISKDESLIILNMESKRNESKTNTENNNNAFDIGKSSQIEIYDKSGRKLELSVCKEDIKILKYIGDLKEEFQYRESNLFS